MDMNESVKKSQEILNLIQEEQRKFIADYTEDVKDAISVMTQLNVKYIERWQHTLEKLAEIYPQFDPDVYKEIWKKMASGTDVFRK